jgi:hypothetical protein
MKRRSTYGASNFEKVIRQNSYYIDKTRYIEHLENVRYPVYLRPRRFGKTLFTETLRWYYDIKAKDRFEELFGNLYIGKNPTENHNSYFFLKLDFSGMSTWVSGDKTFIKRQFDNKIHIELLAFLRYYADYLHIPDETLTRFDDRYRNNAAGGLQYLISLVYAVQGKLFIAIDEYDSLTNAMAIHYKDAPEDDNEYLNILKKGGFFRGFFEVIKEGTSNAVDQVYITGILPITIADMTSGFNIPTWITFNRRFANMLGITRQEFNQLIDEVYKDHEITFDKDRLKKICEKYYNGYQFLEDSEKVYNPMMLMYLLDSIIYDDGLPELMADNNLKIDYNQIAFIFGNNIEDRDFLLSQITNKKEILKPSTLSISFDMNSYKQGRFISEGLFFLGILTHSGKPEIMKISNLVTYEFVLSYFNRINDFDIQGLFLDQIIKDYLFLGDVETLIHNFFEKVVQAYPGDFFKNVNESYYHGLLFYILWNGLLRDKYEVLPEFTLPNGQVDIMAKSFPGARVQHHLNDLFELKQVPKNATDAELNAKYKEAVSDMEKYRTGEYTQWRGIAVCFRGNRDYKIKILS